MSQQEISIETAPSMGDYFRAMLARTLRARPPFVWFFGLIIAPMIVLSIFVSWGKPEFISVGSAIAIFFGLGVYVFVNIYVSAKRLAAKSITKIYWTFSSQGYKVRSEFGNADVKWDGIEEIDETKHAFLLGVQRPLFWSFRSVFSTKHKLMDFVVWLGRMFKES